MVRESAGVRIRGDSVRRSLQCRGRRHGLDTISHAHRQLRGRQWMGHQLGEAHGYGAIANFTTTNPSAGSLADPVAQVPSSLSRSIAGWIALTTVVEEEPSLRGSAKTHGSRFSERLPRKGLTHEKVSRSLQGAHVLF